MRGVRRERNVCGRGTGGRKNQKAGSRSQGSAPGYIWAR